MPKYLLLKHYRGGPASHRRVPPMDQWAPEDVAAHLAFLRHVSELLERNGEVVDAQALTPARTWVRYGGPDAAPVTTDGPLPETWHAVRAHLHELGGDLPAAATAYAEAARRATTVAERDHLVRQAAQARAAEPGRTSRATGTSCLGSRTQP